MTCDDVRERFLLLSEDELPAEEALAVRAHLAECAACAAAWREVARVTAELRCLPLPYPQPGLRQRVAAALDAADESKVGTGAMRRSPWEAAALFVAAAAVVLVALGLTVFLAPGRGVRVVQAPMTYAPSSPEVAVRPPGAGGEATPKADSATAPPGNEQQAVAEAIRKLQEAQKAKALADNDRSLANPPSGARPAPPEAGGPAGKPPGTFGVETTETTPGIAKAPEKPTTIELSFLPPENPGTGTTVNGTVEIVARADIPKAVLTATGDEGLTIGKPGGVLYEGPLRAGESVRVPVPMEASTGGTHEVNLRVQSDAPGGDAQLKVFVPGFTREAGSKPPPEAGSNPVSLVFQNAPIRQALMDVAKQGGLRLEMAEGLGAERISRDVRGVPARAALRAIAEAGGYRLAEENGVFRVSRAGDAEH